MLRPHDTYKAKSLVSVLLAFTLILSSIPFQTPRAYAPAVPTDSWVNEYVRSTDYKNGTYTQKFFSEAQVYFNSSSSQFEPIDSNLRDYNSTHYRVVTGLYRVYFAKSLTLPWHVVYEYKNYSVKMRFIGVGYIDYKNHKYALFTLPTLSAPHAVYGNNTIMYQNVFGQADVIFRYQNNRLKEEILIPQVTIDALPNPAAYGLDPANTLLTAGVRIEVSKVTLNMNGSTPIGNFTAFNTDFVDDGKVQFSFSRSEAWDSQRDLNNRPNNTAVVRQVKVDVGSQMLIWSGVSYSWITATTGVVTIDPTTSTYSSSSFGNVQFDGGAGVSCSFVRSQSAGNGANSGNGNIGQNYNVAGPFCTVMRGLARFDSSSLPDDASISAVKLQLKDTTDSTTTDFIVKVQKWTEASDGIGLADYDAFDGVNYDDNTRSTAGLTSGNSFNVTISTFSIISKTSFTDIMVRSSRDINSQDPTGNEYFYFDVAPILYVTYIVPRNLNLRFLAGDSSTVVSSIFSAYMSLQNSTSTYRYTIPASGWVNFTGQELNKNVTITLQLFNTTNTNSYLNLNQSSNRQINVTGNINRILVAEVRQDTGANFWITVGSGLMAVKELTTTYQLEPLEANVNSTKYTSQSSEWTYSSAGGNYLFRLAKSTFGQGNLSNISLDTTTKILSFTSTNSTTTWNIKWQAPQQDGGGGEGPGGGGGLPALPSLNFTLPAIALAPPPDPKLVTAGALTVSLIITTVLVYNQIQARLRPSLKWAGIQAKSNSKKVKWKRGRWSKRFGQ